MATKMPKSNIHWSKIPAKACVVEHKHYFEARVGRKRSVVFWGSQDATQAQAALKRRAAGGCWYGPTKGRQMKAKKR